MGTINKDLGPVTAYAYAKEGGYTGTATQFKKDLADSANIVNTIDEMISDKADLVNGKVPSSQLPSYVDDVIEGYYKQTDGKFYEESTYETEITGEAGKIYVDLTTDNLYRWSGSAFVKINDVDVTAKADKVANATNGNLASLDANGNLRDSGKKASDFLTQHQTIKQDGVTGATVNRFAVCETAGDVRKKVVSSIKDGSLSLEMGARISVYFNEPNTALNPRLNINNSGDYAIYYKGKLIQNAPDIYMLAGQCDFIYFYESYELVGSVNANIPKGGTTGQVLKKSSDDDYALEWGEEGSGGIDMVDGAIYEKVYTIDDLALKFSSDGDFTLSAPKKWNGTLEYTIDDGSTWNTWTGSRLSGTASQPIYLRGTGNTVITGSSGNQWTFTGKYCTGNIENLLDYQTVANGEHPAMGNYCYRSMFWNCTSLTTAPELPATTLTTYCYDRMFNNCTSLIQAPELPATTLANSCYYGMFYGCTSLKFSTTQTGEYQYAYRIPTAGTGTDATSALEYMFASTGGTFTGTPTINTTYYTTNQPV